MPSDLVIKHDCIILDACCLINLYSSGHMKEILECVPKTVAVASYVKDREIRRFSLKPFIEQGMLHVVAPNSEMEEELYVNFAAMLEDGESVTGAIAVSRNWAIGTDDRRAIDIFIRNARNCQIVSSLELIKNWSDETDQSAMMISNVFRKLKRDASYEPRRNHLLYAWWKEYIAGK